MPAMKVIFHIPHSSTFIPESCRSLFYLDEEQLRKELLRMTDLYTDELFDVDLNSEPGLGLHSEDNRIIFPYSRLICDVERFRDDRKEIMAERGMGVCYTVTSSLKPLKMITADHQREMLALYDAHHRRLTEAVRKFLRAGGDALGTTGEADKTLEIHRKRQEVLLIDCHSFASEQLPYEGTALKIRPDICIGTDDYHTPAEFAEALAMTFRRKGYTVGLNTPFSGTLVPEEYYLKEPAVHSVMIEVKRSLYMNERTGQRTDSFRTLQEDISDAVRLLTGWGC